MSLLAVQVEEESAKSGETKQQLRESQESFPQQVYIHTEFL